MFNNKFFWLIMLLGIFILVVIGLFSVAMYYIINNEPVNSICLYIISLPFVSFVEFMMGSVIYNINLNFKWFYLNINILFLLIVIYVWFIKRKFVERVSFKKNMLSRYVILFMIGTSI